MKNLKCIGKCFVWIVLVGAVGFGAYYIHFKYTVKKATASLDKGFPAVAAETLECHRKCLVEKPDDCKLLINTYFGARLTDRLEWATQACLENGVETPEVYMGLAAAREMSGRIDDALRVLGSVIEKFKDIPDIYYRMAQLLIRKENHQGAIIAYQQAMQRAPDNAQMALEAMDYFSRLKAWPQAKLVADKLRSTQTDNPAVKFLLARVYKNAADDVSAKLMIADGQALLVNNPNRADIEAGFADVLKPGSK